MESVLTFYDVLVIINNNNSTISTCYKKNIPAYNVCFSYSYSFVHLDRSYVSDFFRLSSREKIIKYLINIIKNALRIAIVNGNSSLNSNKHDINYFTPLITADNRYSFTVDIEKNNLLEAINKNKYVEEMTLFYNLEGFILPKSVKKLTMNPYEIQISKQTTLDELIYVTQNNIFNNFSLARILDVKRLAVMTNNNYDVVINLDEIHCDEFIFDYNNGIAFPICNDIHDLHRENRDYGVFIKLSRIIYDIYHQKDSTNFLNIIHTRECEYMYHEISCMIKHHVQLNSELNKNTKYVSTQNNL